MTEEEKIHVTQEHADAFLRSLWPCGEMNHLSNHTRSFLEGLCGMVPKYLRYNDLSKIDTECAQRLSGVLYALADYIAQGRK